MAEVRAPCDPLFTPVREAFASCLDTTDTADTADTGASRAVFQDANRWSASGAGTPTSPAPTP
ncbi:hypothetical protein [Actinosynnema sp. NPDC023587]|uniref:hypothetical protein n=1 Tax=Actinosynnema sp. NPDC023587 TaxID=3154695 RepID=UPI0033FA7369